MLLTHALGVEYWDHLYHDRLDHLDDDDDNADDDLQSDDPLTVWFGTAAVLAAAATVAALPNHRTVWDIGAGDGHLSRVLLRVPGVRRVLCSDRAPHAVLLCRALHDGCELLPDGGSVDAATGSTIEYFVDDVAASIVADDSVDVAVDKGTLDAIAAFHPGVAKRLAWAATLARVLRHGAHLVLLTSNHTRHEVQELLDSVTGAEFELRESSCIAHDDFGLLVFRLNKPTTVPTPPRCTATSFVVADCSLRVLQRQMRTLDDDSASENGAAAADDDELDANFFEPDYELAATTGSNVWESSFVCASALNDPEMHVFDGIRGKRVVELGAGVGLLSLAMAAFGAHVLSSDVAPVVKGLMCDNIALAAPSGSANVRDFPRRDVWQRALALGTRGGSIVAAPINWLEPLSAQFDEPLNVDFVVAADTLWLESLVEPFVSTAMALLGDAPSHRRMLLAYRERGDEHSTTFCTTDRVLDAFRARRCTVAEQWRHVSHKAPEKYVILFEIKVTE